MNKIMMFTAVVAMSLTANLAHADEMPPELEKEFLEGEGQVITLLGGDEPKMFNVWAKEFGQQATLAKLENASFVGKHAAWAVIRQARKCMMDKGEKPTYTQQDGVVFEPSGEMYNSCIESSKEDGAKYIRAMVDCKNGCPPPKVEEVAVQKTPKATQPPPAPATSPLTGPYVMVYNTTQRQGLAAKFAERLKLEGFKRVDTGNFEAGVPWERSSVTYNCAFEASAEKVRKMVAEQGFVLGAKQPCRKAQKGQAAHKYDIEVILGNKGGNADAPVVTAPKPEPAPRARKQPAPEYTEPAPETEPAADDSDDSITQWIGRNHQTINNALGVPALSLNGTVRGLWSFPDRIHALPMPNATLGPNFRLMFDNEYAPFAFVAGPLVNVAYQSSVLSGEVVPMGLGGHIGAEAFYVPLMHKPASPSMRKGYWADKLLIGGYVDAEYMATLFRTTSSPMKPFEQQYVLLSGGGSVRVDFPKRLGGIIFRTGPTIGLKYERQNGWWQQNQTLFPAVGWSFNVELFGRFPDMNEQLANLGNGAQESRNQR